MKKSQKKLVAVLVIIVLALIAYGIIPAAIATSPGSMHNGDTYYIYGTVAHRLTYDNSSVLQVNDSGHCFYVFYNGSAPAVGTHVLVHGKYNNDFIFSAIKANSVYSWYYSL